jgi:hypothetical protein
VIETRTTMSPVLLRYMDSLGGILREGGFSVDQTHHALHVLGSRVLGFNQDLFDDSQADAGPEVAAIMAQEMAATYPYITEMAVAISHEGGLGGCDDDVEFAFGLDLILDGLERLVTSEPASHAAPTPRAASKPRPADPRVTHALRELREAVQLLETALAEPR